MRSSREGRPVAAVLLAVAIVVEVASTALLPRTNGFSNPLWSLLVLAGYAVSIGLLAAVVKSIPVSVTYAVWSGAGTALVAVVGLLFLGESLSRVQVGSLALIVVGVMGLNMAGSH
jgi:small multidrug resistance pump